MCGEDLTAHFTEEEVVFFSAHMQAYKNVKIIPIEQNFGPPIACSPYSFRELWLQHNTSMKSAHVSLM